MKKIAVIPSLEPDQKLLPLLRELKQNDYYIIVIDDGSGRDYEDIFKEAGKYAKVIVHEKNRGKGAALKNAFTFIKDNFKDYLVITLDSDGQHKVSDANKLVDYLEKNKEELVLGKRLRNEKTPLRSKVGNAITRFIFSLATGLDIYDTQTGLRAFDSCLMPYMLNLPGERFEYEMNMLMYAPINKIKITELEIETIYFNNNEKSHFNALKDSFKIYREIFRFASFSFIIFLIDYFFFVLFNEFTSNILASVLLSKVISAFLNYVIASKKRKKITILSYALMVILALIFNLLLLSLFVNILHINIYLSKLLVEFFIIIVISLISKQIIKFTEWFYELFRIY